MSRFSNARTKRHTVFPVLLVWLFALASGWANACLLNDRSTHVDAMSDSASLAAHTPIVSPGHVGGDANHDANSSVAKGACLEVWDDGAKAIVKWPSDIDLTFAAMAPPVAFTWPAKLAAATADSSLLEFPAPSPRLPLRTRFSRLAL